MRPADDELTVGEMLLRADISRRAFIASLIFVSAAPYRPGCRFASTVDGHPLIALALGGAGSLLGEKFKANGNKLPK